MEPQGEPVVIIGAGGHAKVVIDIIRSQGRYEIIGCLDNAAPAGQEVAGVAVIGGDAMLGALLKSGISNAFVAIGDNQKRSLLAREVKRVGFRLINVISPYAHIAKNVVLGVGLAVMPGAIVNVDSLIMDNAVINTKATVDHDCLVGACCHIGPGCTLAGCVKVGEGSFLGAGTSVIPGIGIGCWSVIGAGAAVISDMPDGVVAVGVPAKVIKKTGGRGGHHEDTCGAAPVGGQ